MLPKINSGFKQFSSFIVFEVKKRIHGKKKYHTTTSSQNRVVLLMVGTKCSILLDTKNSSGLPPTSLPLILQLIILSIATDTITSTETTQELTKVKGTNEN
ncbi:hypothetical protein Glove_33g187 [Diversispora epigaea]|uniref:Uncharacterized protein n=1 Tax=Diversispora epigaea TaxID=1348612 RepID=A0A397JQS3_9GLOM|nr:hypothetical protein Glove_33g187 [Diversispora epigaea]